MLFTIYKYLTNFLFDSLKKLRKLVSVGPLN